MRRTRLVPFPVSPVERVDPGLFAAVGAAIAEAQAPGEVPWSPDARDAWEDLYLELSMRRPHGLLAAMTARTEAQIVRLALVYALLDRSPVIDVPHLRAARALWDYAERSVLHVFGDSTGDRHADALRRSSPTGRSSGRTRSARWASGAPPSSSPRSRSWSRSASPSGRRRGSPARSGRRP